MDRWTFFGSMYTSVEPHHTITARFSLFFPSKPFDIANDGLSECHLVRGLLDVPAVEPSNVATIEHRGKRTDPAEFLFHRLEDVWRQDTGAKRRLVAVLARNIPSAKYKLLHVRQGDELLDQGKPRIGSLAQTNALHLGKGSKGLRQTFAREKRARDKSGGDGAQAGSKTPRRPPAG